jgi:hypothetical protein
VATSERRHGYLTSNKNLVGMGLAVIGPILAIAGVVAAPLGVALIVPLYAAGALAMPGRKKTANVVVGGIDGENVLRELDEVEQEVHGKVHPAVESRVHRIATTIRETLPRANSLGPGSDQAYTLVQTATDYLPDALGAYMKLPRSYAEHQRVSEGKTPLQLLCEQLDLLGTKMDQVFTAVCQADADALVAHGHFLEDKFAPGSLDLGGPPPPPAAGRSPSPGPPSPGPSSGPSSSPGEGPTLLPPAP